ncbi:hypothetical protein [Gordonia neofelifaecis]|uniref:Uncharacterized protein n=1 Tax=Gordonia neofelifaecis NRRL B-59395 TaxID=644548 RepID=F1YE98_9ACTN|nr:hypothetical protein [Gordonia neofelifaecis]EGD56731.1 hypothetical protein SCNU_00095 [Gordonia neofelifaecis NRRL B-59395]
MRSEHKIIQTIPANEMSVVNAPDGEMYRVVAWAHVRRYRMEEQPNILSADPDATVTRPVAWDTVEAMVDPADTGVLVLASSLEPKTDDVIVRGEDLSEEDRVGTARHVPHRIKVRLPRERAEVLGVPYREIGK